MPCRFRRRLWAFRNSFQMSQSVSVQKKADRLPPERVHEDFARVLAEGLR
jgi:hypothetical protein